jgi:hypothetical protein
MILMTLGCGSAHPRQLVYAAPPFTAPSPFSTGQNPICCVQPDGYYGPLINFDGSCCEGQCATVTGAVFGTYLTCQANVDQCIILTLCRVDEDCLGWNSTTILNQYLPPWMLCRPSVPFIKLKQAKDFGILMWFLGYTFVIYLAVPFVLCLS